MSATLFLLLLAHDGSVSSSRLDLAGRDVRVVFTFSLEDLAELARLDLNRNGVVDAAEWSRTLPAIFAYLGDKFRIESCRGEGVLDPLPPALALSDRRAPVTLRMRYVSPQPLDRLKVRCALFREHGGNPRHVAELPDGRTVVFDKDRSEAVASATARRGFLLPGAGAITLVLGAAAVGVLRRRAAGGGEA